MNAKKKIAETPSYGQNIYSLNPTEHVSKTVNWVPGDEEWRFNENMADLGQRALLEKFGWTRDSISYTFNEHGFRADEFTYEPNDSVLFLGCSLTMGIGMNLEDTWVYKAASSLGLRRYNLGIGGGSPDMCFRLAHHWIPRLRPKYVMMLTPFSTRIELVMDNRVIQFVPNMPLPTPNRVYGKIVEELREKFVSFYDSWLSHPANTDMNGLKCSLGVQSICDSFDTQLIEIPMDSLIIKPQDKEGWNSTVARDLRHPGVTWNQAVLDQFLENIV